LTLLKQLSNPDFLFEAWNQLKKDNENSHGLSGLTIKDFQENLNDNIFTIKRFLEKGSYKFSPNRAAVIKKDNGNYRPLQIPEIRDRVVLKALAILLEEKLKDLLVNSEGISFAYQKGKGVKHAILRMKEIFDEGNPIILKADIVNFFEEVDKDILLKKKVFPNLKDNTINFLIEDALSQKLGGIKRLNKKHRESFKNAGIGIPQGNPLSPLLSNIYLADFDKFMRDQNKSIVRYADDFIVLFGTKDEALTGYNQISEYLIHNLGLKIHELEGKNSDKTSILDLSKETITFLSIRFNGKSLLPPSNSVHYLKSRISKIIKNGKLDEDTFIAVYNLITKWISLYSYLDIDRYFESIDDYLLSTLKKKYGARKFNTTKCEKLKSRYLKERLKKKKTPFWKKYLSTKKTEKPNQ